MEFRPVDHMFLRIFGIHHSRIGSELASNDQLKLFRDAKTSLLIFGETVPFPHEVERLLENGVQAEIIVGPTERTATIQRLQDYGATIIQVSTQLDRSFEIIDDKHARITDEPKKGKNAREQFVIRKYKDTNKLHDWFNKFKESIG